MRKPGEKREQLIVLSAQRCSNTWTNVNFGSGNVVATGNLYRTNFRRVEGKGIIQFIPHLVTRNTLAGSLGREVGKLFPTQCDSKDHDGALHRAQVSRGPKTMGTRAQKAFKRR